MSKNREIVTKVGPEEKEWRTVVISQTYFLLTREFNTSFSVSEVV